MIQNRRTLKVSPILIGMLTLFSNTATGSWSKVSSAGTRSEDAAQVMYYTNPERSNFVVINRGSSHSLIAGSILKSYRSSWLEGLNDQGIDVETGSLKVVSVSKSHAIAKILKQGSGLSKSLFSDFPGIMAGDLLKAPKYVLSRRQEVLPELQLFYHELFKDPKSTPYTFELSVDGKNKIHDMTEQFSTKRFNKLLIKGYTDSAGPAKANQIESYQRALTIKQFLIDRLGYQRENVIAIGMGEYDLLDQSNVSGHMKRNRRVIIKVLSSL